MKKGFTMIELIFVIVILGILAAVAIPKLAATRDDANIAKALQDIATATTDITAYYTGRGSFGTASDMTNVDMNGSDMNGTNGFSYLVDSVACIQFKSNDNTAFADGNFSVTNITASTATDSSICSSVQDAVGSKDLNKSYSVGGKKVVW